MSMAIPNSFAWPLTNQPHTVESVEARLRAMAPAVLRRSFRSFSRPEGTTSTNAGRAIGKRVAALTESSAHLQTIDRWGGLCQPSRAVDVAKALNSPRR